MLSNAYFLAKFRFDTVENEPAKNLQKSANFANPPRQVEDFAIGVSDGAQEIVHDVSDTVQTAERVLGKAAVETLVRELLA